MSKTTLFQNEHILWLVIFIGVATWLVFIWKEWRKPRSKQVYGNAIIALITISAIAMLALKPLNEVSNMKHAAVILTKNFNQNQLDSLRSAQQGLKVIPYQENKAIIKVLDSLQSIYVLGNGILPSDFWQFENRSVNYLGNAIPKGITQIKYSKQKVVGEELIIKGNYHKPNGTKKLVLETQTGLGFDSMELKKTPTQNFELRLPLKTRGKFVYHLVEKDSLGTVLERHSIPIEVIAKKPLKVLIVNGFPTFETKYLKNYLGEMGHEVIVRSQLTKGRYKFEYLNTKRSPVYRLNETELSKFDLFLIDANFVYGLSRNTKIAIENSIRLQGLGVFIQTSSRLFQRSKQDLGFQFKLDKVSKARLEEFPKLKAQKYPYSFQNTSFLEEVHLGSNKALTAYKRMQLGRVGTTLVQNTYEWQLSGKTAEYQKFWSDIVNALAKRELGPASWHFDTAIPMANAPLSFQLRTGTQLPEVIAKEGASVGLKQNMNLPETWSGKVYPKKTGWNELRLKGKKELVKSYFVFDSLAWQSVRDYNTQKSNQRHFESTNTKVVASTSKVPFGRFWFFVLSVLGLGYLWLEPKLFLN